MNQCTSEIQRGKMTCWSVTHFSTVQLIRLLDDFAQTQRCLLPSIGEQYKIQFVGNNWKMSCWGRIEPMAWSKRRSAESLSDCTVKKQERWNEHSLYWAAMEVFPANIDDFKKKKMKKKEKRKMLFSLIKLFAAILWICFYYSVNILPCNRF